MHIQGCLSPVKIRNPYTHEFQLVPCGKCDACLSKRSAIMQSRLQQESQCWKYTWFFTLTYDNEHLPVLKLCDEHLFDGSPKRVHNKLGALHLSINEELDHLHADRSTRNDAYHFIRILDELYGGIPYVCSVDAQKFMKRLRSMIDYEKKKTTEFNEKSQAKVRYYLCSEYGPTNYRPHYHGILWFNSDWLAGHISQFICDCWRYGSTNSSPVQRTATRYVSGYTNSINLLPTVFKFRRVRPFSLFSKHPALGSLVHSSSYYKELFFKNDLYEVLYERDQNAFKSVPLWQWLRNSLYPQLSGFSQLDNQQRITLYTVGSSAFERFADFKQYVDSSKQSTIILYLKYLHESKGVYESKLQRWYAIRNKVYYQSEIFGISVRCYVKHICDFYEKLKKENLKLWYQYSVEYSKEHSVLDLVGVDKLFIDSFKDCNIQDLSASEVMYLQQYTGLDLLDYFSDDLQTRFAYQSVIDPTNSYDFHILKERSRLNVRNSSKTKRKNEFLMEGTKFRDYIYYFDRKLKENGI